MISDKMSIESIFPKKNRITSVLDKGLPVQVLSAYLDECSPFIDIAKIGWGISLIEKPETLESKISLYGNHSINCCPGGTLFEYFFKENHFEEFVCFTQQSGFYACEISDGTLEINLQDKLDCIKRVVDAGLVCISEVGSKDPNTLVSPLKWCKQIEAELNAGASYVILEGRESGSSGMYRQSGEMRLGLLDEIIEYGIPLDKIIFEAPNKDFQSSLIHLYGPNVNLGNIDIFDVKPLETLRRGLRSDTLLCEKIITSKTS